MNMDSQHHPPPPLQGPLAPRSALSRLKAETFLPFLETVRTYKPKDFRGDLLAGLSVAPVAIPQAMAYALIAGVHPKYGIYASILPVILAALWGSSRFLAAGPTNAISMILFSTLAQISVGGVLLNTLPLEQRMTFIFGIAILTGLIQIAMGLARLGDLANFISHSVMVGFASGAALLIAAGQFKNMLGLEFPTAAGFFPSLIQVAQHLGQTQLASLLVTLVTVLLIVLCKGLSRRLPAALLALILVSLGGWALDMQAHGVKLVGNIPQELPPLSLPPALNMAAIRDLFLPALAIALLGAVESLAIGKNLAAVRGDNFDGSRELIGQGLGNVAAGLTSGIPGCGSFTRSVLNVTSGGRTRFATVFSGILTIPMLLLLAPLGGYIPLPALGGILLVIAWGMIDKAAIRLCLVATRVDRVVLLTTFGAALLLDLEQAVFLGVLLSLVLFIYKAAHPRVLRLGAEHPLLAPWPWAQRCPHMAVYVIEGTLFFGAISELERQLHAQESCPAKVIVLHLSRVFWIDASGAHALEQFTERCHARSIPLILVADNAAVQDVLKRTGVLEHLGEGFIAMTMPEGLRFAHDLLRTIPCGLCPDRGAACLAPDHQWPGDPLPPGEGYGTREARHHP